MSKYSSKQLAAMREAAPDMYDALRGLLPLVADLDAQRETGEPEIPELVAARAAIAKAEAVR